MKNYSFIIAQLFLVFLLAAVSAGCGPDALTANDLDEPALNEIAAENGLALPAPLVEEGSVTEAINFRISVRNFIDEPMDKARLASLLWAAGGKKIDGETGPTRTAPSAGGAYPLEVYLLAGNVEGMEAGVYRYDYTGHVLEPLIIEDRRTLLAEAALGQDYIADAPAVIVLVAHYERTTARYGERGERYVLLDAGHVSQNISLQAVELGLGSVVIGAFEDQRVADIIAAGGEPLLILPVGVPAF